MDQQILLIRPKTILADDGNYRESRWFSAWTKTHEVEDFILPRIVQDVTKQSRCPIGDAVIAALDVTFGIEICEELFAPDSPHVSLYLDGVDVIGNGSASHHELRKLKKRLDLIQSASAKVLKLLYIRSIFIVPYRMAVFTCMQINRGVMENAYTMMGVH
jgi:NAD+ synthase (glutamine-hydrolysing)